MLLPPRFSIIRCQIKENTEMPYEVRFENAADKPSRTFPLKYLAYAEPTPVQFAVGARIIAQYVGEKYEMLEPLAYYAGIIAEEAKSLTQERYLVFFDQGYAQYCHHEQVKIYIQSLVVLSESVSPLLIFVLFLFLTINLSDYDGLSQLARRLARYLFEISCFRFDLSERIPRARHGEVTTRTDYQNGIERILVSWTCRCGGWLSGKNLLSF